MGAPARTGGKVTRYSPYNVHTVFVVLCFVDVILMESYEPYFHIHQGRFSGTWDNRKIPPASVKWPEEHDGYQTKTKRLKAQTVCIILGVYEECCHCDRSGYQSQGQVATSKSICGMWLVVPALGTCFRLNTSHIISCRKVYVPWQWWATHWDFYNFRSSIFIKIFGYKTSE